MALTIVRRLYFYAAAFIGLQMLAAGASDLLAALLERLIGPTTLGAPEQSALRLSSSAALLLIGLLLWGIHWWAVQRGAAQPDEQRSALRRLYLYLALGVAALSSLFALGNLVSAVVGYGELYAASEQLASAIATLVIYPPLWLYHWRLAGRDRMAVELAGAPATLRRWYLVVLRAVSLAMMSVGGAMLLSELLRRLFGTTLGSTLALTEEAGVLAAGLVFWLAHQWWAYALLERPSPLQPDEARSTLRQVYNALAVAASAIAVVGGLATMLYAVLLAVFGGASWSTLLSDHTQALAVAVVAAPLWAYHRRALAGEARADRSPERGATAQRVFEYLMAAVGLAALFFGLGGLLATLARLALAPDALGSGWRDPLSMYLALSLVALPVYTLYARAVERRASDSPAERRALSRRIYLYAALLFGIVATVVATVALLRLLLGALLGAAEADFLAESGRWAGYALVGGAIVAAHVLLLRRSGPAHAASYAGRTIAVVAEDDLREALMAALARELPGAELRPAAPAGTALPSALASADTLVVQLAALLADPAGPLGRFAGQRVALAGPVPGWQVAGARKSHEALAREAVQLLRSASAEAPAHAAPVAHPAAP